MDFTWKGYGFQLHCDEEFLPSNNSMYKIEVSAIAPKELIIPEEFEAVSGLYFIDCPYKFRKPVTIRIQHCATGSSLEHLVFATSLDRISPYRFHSIEGKFDSNFGELKVTSFSPFIILRRLFCCFSSSRRISYSVFLYFKDKIIEENSREFKLVIFIVKQLETYETVVENRAAKMKLQHHSDYIVEFNEHVSEIQFEHRDITKNPGLEINTRTAQSLSKDIIDRYCGGKCIPKCVFKLINSNAAIQIIDIRFDMKGVKGPQNFILFDWRK